MGLSTVVETSGTVVEEHNKLRRKHGLSDLQICPLIEAEAQRHAETLAKNEEASSADMEAKYWINVCNITKNEKADAMKEAVKKLHDFHFLHPLVGSMGIGAALKGNVNGKNQWIVVMLYNAPKMSRSMQYRGSI